MKAATAFFAQDSMFESLGPIVAALKYSTANGKLVCDDEKNRSSSVQ
jgi:hypothetical protein